MNENLRGILDAYDRATDRTIEEIINELKRNSQTYKQVESKLMRFKKEIQFEHPNKYSHLFSEILKLLEEEKNDLPLTNRSNSSYKFSTVTQMRNDYNLEPIEDGDAIQIILQKELLKAKEGEILVGIDPSTYLGSEILKQSKEIISLRHGIDELEKKVAKLEVLAHVQLIEIKRKINSIQWCVTTYSLTLLILLGILFYCLN